MDGAGRDMPAGGRPGRFINRIRGYSSGGRSGPGRGLAPPSRSHSLIDACVKTLPLSAVRALHMAAQGLLTPPCRQAVKADVLDSMRNRGSTRILPKANCSSTGRLRRNTY